VIEEFVLADELRDVVIAAAQSAFPNECCGLIEGVRSGSVVRALAVHPTHNLATDPERFEIDPVAHIALLKSLRGSGREVVGCYHSHPNGSPALSACDLQGAFEQDFLWLVVAIAPRCEPCCDPRQFSVTLAAFEAGPDGACAVPVSSPPRLDPPAHPPL
jgi:proteasome lid subunit RPN8/RPN11